MGRCRGLGSCGFGEFWWGVVAGWVLVGSGVVLSADWVLVGSGGFWWGVVADWVLVGSGEFWWGVVRWYGPRPPHQNP